MSIQNRLFRRLVDSARQVFSDGNQPGRTKVKSRRAGPVMVEALEQRQLMSAAPALYASDGNGLLYTLNVNTGYTHTIGHLPTVLYDLAYSPNGTLYGVDSRSNLYTINTTTAATHYIGYTGAFLNGLTFSSNGTLWASGGDGIYTVSTATGKASEFGTLGSNTSAGDLAFDKYGSLYLSTNANDLIRINLSARVYYVLGNIGYSQVYGLAYANGVLYGFSNSSKDVFTLNTSTGHGTYLSTFRSSPASGINGATFGTAPAPVPPPSRPTIYASDNDGELYRLNLGTGQASAIGNLGVVLFDLAEDKYGDLYGVDSSSNLYRINTSDAQVTYIGYTGTFLNALTFSPGGTLWAAGNNGLYTVSTSTGHATEFGTVGNLDSSGDLAFDASGNLYWTDTDNDLIRINVSARTYADVGNIGFNEVYGLVYGSDGVLYGLSNTTDQAFSINVTTGHGTVVSSFAGEVDGINGAASAPV